MKGFKLLCHRDNKQISFCFICVSDICKCRSSVDELKLGNNDELNEKCKLLTLILLGGRGGM